MECKWNAMQRQYFDGELEFWRAQKGPGAAICQLRNLLQPANTLPTVVGPIFADIRLN